MLSLTLRLSSGLVRGVYEYQVTEGIEFSCFSQPV